MLAKQPGTVVGSSASFHADQARRQVDDEWQKLIPRPTLGLTSSTLPLSLTPWTEKSLGQIDPYGDNAHALPLRLIDENDSFHLSTFDASYGNFAAPSGRRSPFHSLAFFNMIQRQIYNHPYFLKHCEIVALLVNREDRTHPSVKHHIRNAIREASNHVGFGPGNAKCSAEFMSLAAKEQLERGLVEGLIAEHVVPVSVLNDLIVKHAAQELATVESVAQLLMTHTHRAVITTMEDKQLRNLGLHKSMPVLSSDDWFARYREAHIELIENKYAILVKHTSDVS